MEKIMKEIFILEDDEGIRELTQLLLENEGYDVCSFATAENFHLKLKQVIPDLFLIDIRLPDGDGREICRELRRNEKTAHLPIILMSANSTPDKSTGADDFIPKPFDIDEFLGRIRTRLLV